MNTSARVSNSKSSLQSALDVSKARGSNFPIEPGPVRRRASEQPFVFIGTLRPNGPAGRWQRQDASKADVLDVLRRR